MGLFDSFKKNLDNLVQEVDKHKDDIQKGLESFAQQARETQENRVAEPVSEPEFTPIVEQPAYDQFDRFDAMISSAFADYEVRRRLPASELKPDCHPKCAPVQFMFYEDGEPVLAVVLVRKNNYRGMNVIATKEICENLGIRYIRFYEEYENAESYVIQRIKDNL